MKAIILFLAVALFSCQKQEAVNPAVIGMEKKVKKCKVTAGDWDGDCVKNEQDNCPLLYNPEQLPSQCLPPCLNPPYCDSVPPGGAVRNDVWMHGAPRNNN